ncbi:LOW QUALITY PROTEIN: hypothetical protein V2J09_022490 [Rumex salicifolius]
MKEFEMTDLGILQRKVSRERVGFFVCQRKYAKDTLKKFYMEGCDVEITPINTNEKLQREDGKKKAEIKVSESWWEARIILLIEGLTLPIVVVSSYMQSPTKQHIGATKRILRYVAGIINHGISYGSIEGFILKGHTDSAITWSSKKQCTVALSSFEAKYDVVGLAARQALWLAQEEAIDVWCDNKSTIAMTKNPAFHARIKHINVQHHFIRNLVFKEKIVLKSIALQQKLFLYEQLKYVKENVDN